MATEFVKWWLQSMKPYNGICAKALMILQEVMGDLDIQEFDIKGMKNFKYILIVSFVLLGCNVILKSQIPELLQKNKDGERDQEYYFAFTEATKFYLFGNYTQAVGLYNECLKIRPTSAAVYYQLGRIFLISGNPAMSRELTKKAVMFDGNNSWYLQQLADLYQYENKSDSAVLIYDRLLKIKPDDLNTTYSLAILQEKLKNSDKALFYLNVIENKVGISKEVSLAKYRIYEHEGKYEPALQQLKQAYVISGKEYNIAGILAEFFSNHQKPDSARHYYEKIYPAFANDAVVAFSYADYLMNEKKYNEATEVLLSVIREPETDQETLTGYFYKLIQHEALFNKAKPLLDSIADAFYSRDKRDIRVSAIFADIQFKLKNYNKAALALKEIVKQDKRNYPALEQLVYAYNLMDSAQKVVEYSRYGLDMYKDKPLLYLFGGAGHYRLEQYLQASEWLEKGLVISDSEELQLEFLSLLGEVYEQLKMYEQSERAFIRALTIDEDNNGIKNNFAYFLSLRKEKLEYAAKLSKATVNAEPENATYLDTYGWIWYMKGKNKKAEKFVLKALNTGGRRNVEILMHYAEILISLGKREDAIYYLNQARELSTEEEKEEILKRIEDLLSEDHHEIED